jgi:MFS family permease
MKILDYKWLALSNTTLGVLMASLNSTSLIIAMPVIFRGLQVDPLAPSSFDYLLWLLMGYLVVTAVLVVTMGRLGDIYGRVRIYNLGFLVFTLASVGLASTWSTGAVGALELIIMRMIQAVGGAMLMANSAAILTDAFPEDERGTALGINQIAGMAGGFLGIIVGGMISEISWRWVFLFNVPNILNRQLFCGAVSVRNRPGRRRSGSPAWVSPWVEKRRSALKIDSPIAAARHRRQWVRKGPFITIKTLPDDDRFCAGSGH